MILSKRTFHQLATLAELHKLSIEEYLSRIIEYEFGDIDTYCDVSYMEYVNLKIENRMIDPKETVDI